MNQIIIHGRLTRDPAIKSVTTGDGSKLVANFSVAVDRKFGAETDFFECQAWGKTAELIERFFSKGREIMVQGEMQSRRTQKEGQNRTYWAILVNQFDFCGKKDDVPERAGNGDQMVEDDEDVPF